MPRDTAASSRGFTLIELLAVMAVMGICIAMGAPLLRDNGSSLSVQIATLPSLFDSARSLAVSRLTKTRVVFQNDPADEEHYRRWVSLMTQAGVDAEGSPIWQIEGPPVTFRTGIFYFPLKGKGETATKPLTVQVRVAGRDSPCEAYEYDETGLTRQTSAPVMLVRGYEAVRADGSWAPDSRGNLLLPGIAARWEDDPLLGADVQALLGPLFRVKLERFPAGLTTPGLMAAAPSALATPVWAPGTSPTVRSDAKFRSSLISPENGHLFLDALGSARGAAAPYFLPREPAHPAHGLQFANRLRFLLILPAAPGFGVQAGSDRSGVWSLLKAPLQKACGHAAGTNVENRRSMVCADGVTGKPGEANIRRAPSSPPHCNENPPPVSPDFRFGPRESARRSAACAGQARADL